jgi:glycosyltransferase involved in cell wall biosynthesis
VPAVATRVGSVAEDVKHDVSGLLCTTEVEALSVGVGRLLADSALRDRLGRGAAAHARNAFGRDRLVEDTERLYEDLAEAMRLP